MNKLVLMVVAMFVQSPGGELEEVWNFKRAVTVEHCLDMADLAAGVGPRTVLMVSCNRLQKSGVVLVIR